MASSSSTPNNTLYINNLNDKINKDELRTQLYALFATYGKLIDIVASKGPTKRGQAFLVFADLAGATAAMRACEGMLFYEKPLHIHYAKSKSHATLKREDPSFVPPSAANVTATPATGSKEKRRREPDAADSGRPIKREKGGDDDDGEEMEIDEEEEAAQLESNRASIPQVSQQPSARLLCTNLPQEVTSDVLSVLFQQYQGFQTTHVVPSPTPNAAGATVKMAQVLFDSPDLASVAREALDGFTLKKGWKMAVAYI